MEVEEKTCDNCGRKIMRRKGDTNMINKRYCAQCQRELGYTQPTKLTKSEWNLFK